MAARRRPPLAALAALLLCRGLGRWWPASPVEALAPRSWATAPGLRRPGCQRSGRLVQAPGARRTQARAGGAELSEGQDWRGFRARLVKQELAQGGTADGPAGGGAVAAELDQGWAYATPLVEQGSLLLSTPGDHFALNQQYFHKCVILIISHGDDGDVGVILNRPTAFSAAIVAETGQNTAMEGLADWNVWFGGDCHGLNPDPRSGGKQVQLCLHTSPKLAGYGRQIIPGIWLIELAEARTLVADGLADKDDFLLLVGYCGWAAGQLQDELDRGDTWTPAAADRRVLLGELRDAQASLTARLQAARAAPRGSLTAADLGDGLDHWQRLYAALGADLGSRLADGEAHADEMLRLWIERSLLPAPAADGDTAEVAQDPAEGPSTERIRSPRGKVRQGSILRGSATAWVLGKPAEWAGFDLHSFGPAQYLHKSVLIVLRDAEEGMDSVVVLVNGPRIGKMTNGQDILFGGANELKGGAVMEVGLEPSTLRLHGLVALTYKQLQKMLELCALEVVPNASLRDILDAPPAERWAVAGGQVPTLREARLAALGDEQRRQWYLRFLGLRLPEG